MDLPQSSEVTFVNNTPQLENGSLRGPAESNLGTEGSQKIEVPKQKRKKPSHPPTSEMVLESIKDLKKRKGATTEEIHKQIEEKYDVNMNKLSSYVNKFLDNAVEKGILEQVGRAGGKEAFKIKKESTEEGKQTLARKGKDAKMSEKNPKTGQKLIAPRKKVAKK